MGSAENKPPILHILVVGFHHKLGCQVEFSYPPLISGTTGINECPSGWKYLPTLALPDGSHNFLEDTVFFNLPSLTEPTESVYGVSCYRQIPVEQLKIRTADVTRSTVQKSVCILARQPIYGYIEVKLSLIADTFFEQGDFSCTELLKNAYQQLNACLLADESHRPLRHFYVGLPVREVLLLWRHKTLILFKLFLLQRRVVCFGSPVRHMCTLILSVSSLIPRLLEKGFQEVACVRTSRPLSPMPDFTDSLQREAAEVQETEEGPPKDTDLVSTPTSTTTEASAGADDDTLSTSHSKSQAASSQPKSEVAKADLDSAAECSESGKRSSSLSREASVDTLTSNLLALCSLSPDEYRAPISIFASGNLCLPYLSLPYMDLLTDPSVLSYVIGTSNVLFQQKRQLADVHVDIENTAIETHDAELRRQLTLGTEDLRFMDYMLKHAQAPKEDAEGSEHWIREQFQGYLLALLRTAVLADATSKESDHFNANFMYAFKRTQCYQEWYDVRPDAEFFENLPAGHPFAGTLSVTDMKLKIAQTMQNSESGRKINQAVNNTSRAVGGAISQAKGAFSNWWSAITTPQPTSVATPSAVVDLPGSDTTNQKVDVSEVVRGESEESRSSSEKLTVDSAEEFEETEIAICGEPSATPQTQGIVEIGREAEILNEHEIAAACSKEHGETETTSNGEIFIV